MADDYPWLKEYISLIDWCRSRWGGKVLRNFSDRYSGPGFSINVGGVLASASANFDDEEEAGDIYGLDSYPHFHTAIDDVPVEMGFSNADVWFVSMNCHLKWQVLVRHEHWADRMFKKLKLDYEFQTGIAEFDRIYYIRGKDKSHRSIFVDGRFRELVQKLEPFGELATTVTGLSISRKIDSPVLLDPSSVEAYIRLLLRLVRYIKQ